MFMSDLFRWNTVEDQLKDTIHLFEDNLVIWRQFEDNYLEIEKWLTEKEQQSEEKMNGDPEETLEERLERLQACKVSRVMVEFVRVRVCNPRKCVMN